MTPWKGLHLDTTARTLNPVRRIDEIYGDAPKRHVLPTSLRKPVITRSFQSTGRTKKVESLVGCQIHNQSSMLLGNLSYSVPIDSKRLSDYAFYKHESDPPFLANSVNQEISEKIHAFNFLGSITTHKFV
jgi:hypothetical protein